MRCRGRGFTLVELLVVISIIGIMLGILLPALSKARNTARELKNMNNHGHIANAIHYYGCDNNDRTPPNISLDIDKFGKKKWLDPRMFVGVPDLPYQHRSIPGFIGSYLENPGMLSNPLAPNVPTYMKEAFKEGDNFKFMPGSIKEGDVAYGHYCFLWGFTAYNCNIKKPFKGPAHLIGGRGQSKVLICDYFGYGNEYTGLNSLVSSNRFKHARDSMEMCPPQFPAFWNSRYDVQFDLNNVDIKLYKAMVDGSVHNFTSDETITIVRSRNPEGTAPDFDSLGNPYFGYFYLPRD